MADRKCLKEDVTKSKVRYTPDAIAFTSGLVSPNIQAKESPMIPIKTQNKASNFRTPKFSRKRNKNLRSFEANFNILVQKLPMQEPPNPFD